MSEQQKPDFKLGYMDDLAFWVEQNVVGPLAVADEENYDSAAQQVTKAIQAKVLESYKNGCRAGAGAVRKEMARSTRV